MVLKREKAYKLTSKNKYQHHIHVYISRRKAYKATNPIKDDFYYAKLKALDQKIRTWKKAIRAIEKKEEKADIIIKLVEDFTGVNVKFQKGINRNKVLARRMYYKYGIENGVDGVALSRYIGQVNQKTGSTNRKKLNSLFKTNDNIKVYYHEFLNYVKLQNSN